MLQEAQHFAPKHPLSVCLVQVASSRLQTRKRLATRMVSGRPVEGREIGRLWTFAGLEQPRARAPRQVRRMHRFISITLITPPHTSRSSPAPSLFSVPHVYEHFHSKRCPGHLQQRHQLPRLVRRAPNPLLPHRARALQSQEVPSSLVTHWQGIQQPTSSVFQTFMPGDISGYTLSLH